MSIAVWFRIASVPEMFRRSEGTADHISATVPERCGVAIEVPLRI
jgi:hypothetical protein